jgi:hypothetical protein
VCELRVILAGNDCRVLAAQDESLVLALEQQKYFVEQHDVQIDLLGPTDAPRQRSFVQHPVLGQIELLSVGARKQTQQSNSLTTRQHRSKRTSDQVSQGHLVKFRASNSYFSNFVCFVDTKLDKSLLY